MIKKGLSIVLTAILLTTPVFATQNNEVIQPEEYTVVARSQLSSLDSSQDRNKLSTLSSSEDSWGYGEIYSTFLNRKVYAKTIAYETAYRMKVQLKVFDKAGTYMSTPTKDEKNVDSVETERVSTSNPSSAYGDHSIQKTSNSGWQLATTIKDF